MPDTVATENFLFVEAKPRDCIRRASNVLPAKTECRAIILNVHIYRQRHYASVCAKNKLCKQTQIDGVY